MVWGQVGLEVDGWRDVKEILTEEERRPRIVDALVERGREVHELDLTQIPARVNMDIGLYRASYRVFPRTIAQQPYENRLSFLEFTSLGNGTYEPLENVYVPRHRSDGDTYMFPRGRSMTMGMADATGQHVPRLAFGKPLWVAIEQKPTELMVHPPGQTFLSECYVGAVVLDGSPLFTHIQ